LEICHLDTVNLHEQGCRDLWLFLTWICLMAGVYSVKRDVISCTVFSLCDVTSRPMFAAPREY
jgi:hypothetical protein